MCAHLRGSVVARTRHDDLAVEIGACAVLVSIATCKFLLKRIHVMDGEESRDLLRCHLNRRLRLVLSDGRVVDGNFLCTDSECNIVIGDCEEFLCQADVGKQIIMYNGYRLL